MSTIIATIQGHDIVLNNDGSVTFTAGANIDNDGSGGNPEGDPFHQDETSLRVNGKSLNAQKVPYIVVPPAIIKGVVPVVLGSQGTVELNGKNVPVVVGDIGPKAKLGEISVECARRLGINPSPLHGGVDGGVRYTIRPGVPAVVDGVTYPLQRS